MLEPRLRADAPTSRGVRRATLLHGEASALRAGSSDATGLDRLNQPGVAQDLQMLVDGGERHIERCREFGYRGETTAQSLDYRPPSWNRQRAKNGVDLCAPVRGWQTCMGNT